LLEDEFLENIPYSLEVFPFDFSYYCLLNWLKLLGSFGVSRESSLTIFSLSLFFVGFSKLA
jgi:hypothetical protein